MAACASYVDDLTDAGERRDGVEQSADARGGNAGEAGVELAPQDAQLGRRARLHRRQVGGPVDARRHTDARSAMR